MHESHINAGTTAADPCLQVYLLGSVSFEAALSLQRLLAYQIAAERGGAALILCEHPPLITVGRQGSRAHILYEPEELKVRGWPVRWVNRGGGSLLHLPGQLAIYPVVALDRWHRTIPAYLDDLHGILAALLAEFGIHAEGRLERPGVWVGSRPIAAIGVAVRHWVAYYGAMLNVSPDLELLRGVRYGGMRAEPMTSVERERHGPLRPSLVRERLVELFADLFGFERTALFFDHPQINGKATQKAMLIHPPS